MNSKPSTKQAKAARKRKNKNKKAKGQPSGLAPVSIGRLKQFTPPNGRRSYRFKASEAVLAIDGTTAFSLDQFWINPGLVGSFPRLVLMTAGTWQYYRFHALRYRYVPRCATTTAGTVIMAPDYNAMNTVTFTESLLENTSDAVEDSPWKEIICNLDPTAMHPDGKPKKVRDRNIAGDMGSYDAGQFTVATVGTGAITGMGKLWVDYDVELSVPVDNNPITESFTRSSIWALSVDQTFTTTVAANIDPDALVTDPLHVGSDVGGIWTPPPGNYLFTFLGTFHSTSAALWSVNLELQMNSAALTRPMKVFHDTLLGAAGSATITYCCPVTTLLADNLRLRCTMTSGGVATLLGNSVRIIFTLI